MPLVRIALLALLPFLATPADAQTQTPPPAVARATIERVSPDGGSLVARTRTGEDQTIRLTAKTHVMLVLPATLAEVRPEAQRPR